MQIGDSTVNYLSNTASLTSIYGGGRRLGSQSPREAVQLRIHDVSSNPAALLAEAQRVNSPDFKRAEQGKPGADRGLQALPNLGPLSKGTPRRLNPENA